MAGLRFLPLETIDQHRGDPPHHSCGRCLYLRPGPYTDPLSRGFMTLPIATERLVLRRFMQEDVPDLLDFLADPSVADAMREIEATEPGVRRYVARQAALTPFEEEQCFDLVVERKADSKVMGLVSLVRRGQYQGEIGWALGVDYRGRGYATEAASALMIYGFASLGLHRFQARTLVRNTDSWKVMERLGMRREAWLREVEFRDGEWQDAVSYAALADEWLQEEGGDE